MDNMTQNDKAATQNLTEVAYRPRQSEGNLCYVCHRMGVRCRFACTATSLCPCLYHRVCRLESLREVVPEAVGSPLWERMVEHINLIQAHNARVGEILLARQKAALHKQNKANAESKLGPREFTLTYSPSWFENDDDAQTAMSEAIEKLTRYYANEIIEFHAVGEYGADRRSHVHAWYSLAGGRKITDKNFKRAYPRWNPKRKLGKGFEGGHHETIERISDFAGYAEKHLEEAWLKTSINNADEDKGTQAASGILGRDEGSDRPEEGSCSTPACEQGTQQGSADNREGGV